MISSALLRPSSQDSVSVWKFANAHKALPILDLEEPHGRAVLTKPPLRSEEYQSVITKVRLFATTARLGLQLTRGMIRNSFLRIRFIVTSKILHPPSIPRRFAIRSRISIRRLLSAPKNRRGHMVFPRIFSRHCGWYRTRLIPLAILSRDHNTWRF